MTSLESLQKKVIKIGARVVRHARRVIFQLAEVAVTSRLWDRMVNRIARLRWDTG